MMIHRNIANSMNGSFVIYAVMALYLFSCSSKSEKLEADVDSMMGQEISIPYKELTSLTGTDKGSASANADSLRYVYVSYLDLSECSPCYFSKLAEWDDIQEMFMLARIPFETVIIIETNDKNTLALRRAYESNGCQREVFLDKVNAFKGQNKILPTDNRLHTFLLNSQNQVVLIGDPVRNRRIKTLLKEYLETIEPKEKQSSE